MSKTYIKLKIRIIKLLSLYLAPSIKEKREAYQYFEATSVPLSDCSPSPPNTRGNDYPKFEFFIPLLLSTNCIDVCNPKEYIV